MDLLQKCKELYEKIRYFKYGIPVDGVIKGVPSAEYFAKNYHFLKPEEFEKYEGGICWDYVEYERKFLEVNDIDFNQYYLITNTPPNYDTHTFITVKDGDELIYIESSFKRVEHIIDGVQKFKSLEDIVRLITTNMWYCNDNDKHFDEFKYDVCKFKGHPKYGCTCEEYMKWMDDNSDIVIQDVSINPKKVNNDELAVEEFAVNKVDTKFTQFVCESVNDPEEYDETLHDHIDDEDDIYNESWTDFKNGVHPSSGLMFHVSLKNDMDGKTINPQLPSYITDGGELDDNYQEDTKTKRLCVSPSIEGCLIAILSYNKIREHVGDKFYVYTPEKPFSQYKHKTNKEIVKDKLVFDANITKEAWILEPCKLKLYGIIKLKKVKDLKKKPTVEKNIKMNTIKLDYEWIMTPKASGKFNKVIGDSPDKEDDTKEKPIKEYDNILISNEEFFEEFVSSKQRNREKKFLKERNFVPDKDNPNKGWIDSDFKDKNGKPIRIRFEINNDSAIASTNSEDRIQMTRKALRTHPGISSADFKHEEGHMFAKQKYKEWAKSHPKPEDMSVEDHMNEFYKSGEFKDFFARVAKDLEKAVEKGMSEHGKNLEEYFADAFALANSLNESMDIKSIRTMGSRINSNKEYNKLLNRFNENIDNIINYVAKSTIVTASNDIKWIKDCPDDIRNNEHFKKLRQAISDCQYYKKLIQIEERTKEFDHRLINIINSSLNDFKSLHDQKSIESKAKLKQNKEEIMVKLKKQDEKIQSMKAELKIKKKFVEDCKKDIHNLYKASAAINSNLTKMQKEIIDDVKKSQKVINNEIEFRTKMLEKLSKDEKNRLKIKESCSVLISNDEFFDLTE